jgi:complex iron-sulfur molybdoenzyme family reductase subunit gamma
MSDDDADHPVRNELLLVGAFAAVVLAAAAVGPMIADARPAFEIPVSEASEDENLDNVSAQGWDEIPAATVSLSSTGSSVPNSDSITVEQAKLGAAQTDERLYLRLSWADPTGDNSTNSLRRFADAVAVQLPTDTNDRPPIAMGGSDNPVNVWYWTGEGRTEELLAGGPGSTTDLGGSELVTDADHSDGRWRVVLSRPLKAQSENRISIPEDSDLDVAVAVWNGSNMERSGQKAASSWHYLALGSDTGEPPYQTILWAIAGIAIVASALITIEGVRRTRGE